jgi:hypothetical protein
MFYSEIIADGLQIHTKRINTLCQRTWSAGVINLVVDKVMEHAAVLFEKLRDTHMVQIFHGLYKT